MKNPGKTMLVILAALMILPATQQATAQERKPKAPIEKREKKPKRKSVRLQAMRKNDFSMMYRIVKNASFDINKIDIIRVACIGSDFSSSQCAELLSLLSFENNRLEALEILAPNIAEFEEYDRIMKLFSFQSNKEKAARILSRQ
jgi:hypothetical protein